MIVWVEEQSQLQLTFSQRPGAHLLKVLIIFWAQEMCTMFVLKAKQ